MISAAPKVRVGGSCSVLTSSSNGLVIAKIDYQGTFCIISLYFISKIFIFLKNIKKINKDQLFINIKCRKK